MSCSVWHSAISDSPAQIFYRYLTQIGIVPLIGTTSNQHMHEDLAIFEYELLPSECESLDGLI
jgi:diketogulonate reductase-like aldo/keto reductase